MQANDVSARGTVSRRSFLVGAAGVAGGMAALSALGSNTALASEWGGGDDEGEAEPDPVVTYDAADRNVHEYEITDVEPPAQTVYESDVLVVGCGFAGLSAAVNAKQAGLSVIVVDKGKPGFSGLAPFASSHRWFDAELGDDEDAFIECVQYGGEYILNLDWFRVWINESKTTWQQLTEWGILDQFPRAADSGYWEDEDFRGYLQNFSEYDRRYAWMNTLNANDITVVPRTMITNLVTSNDRIIGAMGFDVPSGTVVQFSAKAVILCTGTGSYKPSGFPTAGDTFDGPYMGYQLGLPLIGMEFDDMHMTCSYAAGNAFHNNSWAYLNNIWLCGGDIEPDGIKTYATGKAKAMVQDRITLAVEGCPNSDGTKTEDQANSSITRRGGTASGNPDDPRQGKKVDIMPQGDVYGAAVGMCAHLSSGIFCGLEPTTSTGYPGLYCCGDGTNACCATGATYPVGVGFTSSMCSIQGRLAANAAAEYVAGVELETIPDDVAADISDEILAPLSKTTGFDPTWARDQLQAIMSPLWITVAKDEEGLTGALSQVEHLRDKVAPLLMAKTGHDLRMCHEFTHKVLSAELKLRSSLERKESRGLSYRTDYPFRDNDYLCYISCQKGEDGTPQMGRVEIPDEWKGDLSAPYEDRILFRFPGEEEAMGLEPEESSGGWG